jgi:hypothetical protein
MGVSLGGSPNAFGAAAVVLLLLVIVLWFILATTAALRADTVEPPNRVAQMYGYTICLVAVIVGLTTIGSILDAVFQRAYPLQNEFGYSVSLASFEAYKATHSRERAMYGPNGAAPADTASDATLRRRYQALVDERMAATRYQTAKTFVTSGIMFIIAAVLFLSHWRWLHRNQLKFALGKSA